MSFLFSDPPTPPNPYATAQAQTGTNIGTAIANQQLNNINQVTPQGSLNYSQTGTYQYMDPTSGQVYNIPLSTATQSLTDQGQAIQAQREAAQYNMAGLANSQSGRIANLLSTPINSTFNTSGYFAANPDAADWFNSGTSGFTDPTAFAQFHRQAALDAGRDRTGWQVPSGGNAQNILDVPHALTSFDPGGPIQSTFGDAGSITHQIADSGPIQHQIAGAGPIATTFGASGPITTTYGPADNFSADRQRVEDALMARMNPQLEVTRNTIQQQLADQGIRYGSRAYSDAMMEYSRQADDARWGAIQNAGQEQQRMTEEAGALACVPESGPATRLHPSAGTRHLRQSGTAAVVE